MVTHLALGTRIADRTNTLKLPNHIDAFASVATRRTGALVNVNLAVSAYKRSWEWHANQRRRSVVLNIYILKEY